MLIALTLLLPLLITGVIAVAGALPPETAHRVRRGAALAAPVSVVPAVALCLTAQTGSPLAEPGNPTGEQHQGPQLEVPWLLFGAVFALDTPARALLLIAALLYGAALMAVTWAKLRDVERGSGALSAFLLVCFTGNAGTYLAADAVTFYLAFALMSFSAAGLVIHYRTDAARRATRIYLIMSVLSETAILAALVLLVAAGGQQLSEAPATAASSAHAGLITGLLLFGFGVKAGTVPLHVWLPLAHPAAPPAASAVLSGAMVKAGLIGWLRFLPDQGQQGAGWVLLVLAMLGAFAAVVAGVVQSDPKVVLAYSTISQMGFIAALVAVGLIMPHLQGTTTTAAVLYAVHHGLAKGALFLGVPVAKHFGHGRARWLVVTGMVGAALAVAGAPLTSGAYGKYVSKDSVEPVAIAGVSLDQLLPLVATGSTVLLLRFGWAMLRTEPDPDHRPAGELVSWLLICASGIAVPWWVGITWFDEHISWGPSTVWDASWPILLGLACGVVVWLLTSHAAAPRAGAGERWGTGLRKAQKLLGNTLQPGDLIVAEESVVVQVKRAGTAGLDRVHRAAAALGDAAASWARSLAAGQRSWVDRVESRLASWEASGLVMVLLLALLGAAVFGVVLTVGGGS